MAPDTAWRLESVLLLGIRLGGCMILGMLASGFLRPAGGPAGTIQFEHIVISTLSFHAAIIPLVYWFLKEQQTTWRRAFGLRIEGQGPAVVLALTAALLTLPIAWFLSDASARALTWFDVEPVAQSTVTTLRHTQGVGPQLYLAVTAIVLAPAAEEILFRGILYPFIKQRGFTRLAWIVSAAVFGAVHMNLATFIPLVFLALVLTWLYEYTGNLLAPILAHSLFNLANFFWLIWERTAG